MDRGVIVGGVLICASLLIAVLLHQEAHYRALPQAEDKPVSNAIQRSGRAECAEALGAVVKEPVPLGPVAPNDHAVVPAQQQQAPECR